MTDERRCGGCGARMAPTDGACSYCGAPAGRRVAVAEMAGGPETERSAALAAVRAHPSFDALARDVPAVPGVVTALFTLPIVVGSFFVVVPLAIAIAGGLLVGGLGGGLEIGLAVAGFLSLFALMGVGTLVAGLRARRRLIGGPVRAAPAVVLAKRTEPGTSATGYYLTLGFENGERHEFGTLDHVFRSAFEGDAGVAHCRGELLLGFRRVAV